jgi:hypothetical protein
MFHPKVVPVARVTPLAAARGPDRVRNVHEPVDARRDRLAQSLVGIVLLGGFVFRVPLVMPIVAIVLAIGAAGGPAANPLHWAFDRFVAPRLEPVTATVDGASIRASDIAGSATLGVASLLWLVGLGSAGWLLAIVVAIAAIIAATTRIHLADLLLRRPPEQP